MTVLKTSTLMQNTAGHSVRQTSHEPLTSHGSAHLGQIGVTLQRSHAGAKHQIGEEVLQMESPLEESIAVKVIKVL